MKNVYIARKYNEKKMIITHTHTLGNIRSFAHSHIHANQVNYPVGQNIPTRKSKLC